MSTKQFGEKGEWVTGERKERKGFYFFFVGKMRIHVIIKHIWPPLPFYFVSILKENKNKNNI